MSRGSMSGVPDMIKTDDLSEARLWKALDSISDRLGSIEVKLSEVVRLEERVNHHDETLRRYGSRLDNQDSRLRETELWQANTGDRSSIERLVTNIHSELDNVTKEVAIMKTTQNVNKGQKDVGKEVLKWLVAGLTTIVVFKITRG
tara:strand:- start:11225 stop:11662 length:438 start_codon:yes stop_codon:yes gene_type:complete